MQGTTWSGSGSSSRVSSSTVARPRTSIGCREPIVWTFPYSFHLAQEFPYGTRTVYDWIDDLSVFRHWDAGLVRRNHEHALEKATVVAAVARSLHAEALRARPDAIYLPNAVDYQHFAELPERVSDPKLACLSDGRPVAGYYGALARWLDDEMLDETAARRPDWSFVLVGPMYEGGLRGARSLRRPNVIWTGPRHYRSLPGYVAWFDVALIPFRLDDVTRATSPLKLYEYFAAGRPVISTALPECESFPEVRIVRSSAELSEALDTARADSRDPQFVARLRSVGRQNSWRARVETALGVLGWRRSSEMRTSDGSPTARASLPLGDEPRYRLLGVVAIVLLVLALHVGLLHLGGGNGRILGFPVHHDDFRNLSYTALQDLPRLRVRPVSTAVLGLLSIAGPNVYYTALLVLVAVYVALVLSVVRRLFPAAGWIACLTTGAASLGAILFEHVPEYALYSGLVTNLVSAVAAVGAMLALEAEPGSRGGRLAAGAAAVALFTASVLAKEDFALAVSAGFALRTLERHLAGDRHRRTWDLALLLTLVLVSAGFLAWSLGDVRPTFLNASGEYQSVFSPASLLHTTVRYLLCTPGARIATSVQAAVLLVVGMAGDRRSAARVAGMIVVTLALVAPYAALPGHFFPYYAFNWTVWQSATLVALAPFFASARRPAWSLLTGAVVVLLGVWIDITHTARVSLIQWYVREASRNRAIVRTLESGRDALRPWPVVGVTGVMPFNPWFGNDGTYLRTRLGLTNRWVVFASPEYLERTRRLLGSLRMGSINVCEAGDLPRAGFPVVTLTPDGAGRMSLQAPAPAVRSSRTATEGCP